MYESPINIIQGEMQMWVEGETYKALQNVGIDVNKEELLKALQYDRNQYEKGYKEGYAKAIDETCLKVYNHLLTEIEWNRVLVEDWEALAEEFKEVAEQMKGGSE